MRTLRPHVFRTIELLGWPMLVLYSGEYAGPTCRLEQCDVCNAVRAVTDEGTVRYFTRGLVVMAEPACTS